MRAWAGAGIILLLVGIGVTIFLLEAIVAAARSKYTVVAVLQEAPQLTAGSRVWVGGRDVGEVRSLGLLPLAGDTLSRIAAVLELPTSVRDQVRGDSRVRLTSERMIGVPVVDIIPGSPATPRLAPGDTLRQQAMLGSAAVMERARVVQIALDTALAEFRALQGPLQSRMLAFERVQLQLAQAQREYGLLMADVRRSPALALLAGDGTEAAFDRSRTTLQQLMAAFEQLRDRAAATGTEANARALMTSAGRLQASLAELEAAMQQQGGTVDRLVRDSALVNAIAAARAELDSVIADAKRRPLRYVF